MSSEPQRQGDDEDYDLTEEEEAELMRRVDEADAHPEDAIPWEALFPPEKLTG